MQWDIVAIVASIDYIYIYIGSSLELSRRGYNPSKPQLVNFFIDQHGFMHF